MKFSPHSLTRGIFISCGRNGGARIFTDHVANLTAGRAWQSSARRASPYRDYRVDSISDSTSDAFRVGRIARSSQGRKVRRPATLLRSNRVARHDHVIGSRNHGHCLSGCGRIRPTTKRPTCYIVRHVNPGRFVPGKRSLPAKDMNRQLITP